VLVIFDYDSISLKIVLFKFLKTDLEGQVQELRLLLPSSKKHEQQIKGILF